MLFTQSDFYFPFPNLGKGLRTFLEGKGWEPGLGGWDRCSNRDGAGWTNGPSTIDGKKSIRVGKSGYSDGDRRMRVFSFRLSKAPGPARAGRPVAIADGADSFGGGNFSAANPQTVDAPSREVVSSKIIFVDRA